MRSRLRSKAKVHTLIRKNVVSGCGKGWRSIQRLSAFSWRHARYRKSSSRRWKIRFGAVGLVMSCYSNEQYPRSLHSTTYRLPFFKSYAVFRIPLTTSALWAGITLRWKTPDVSTLHKNHRMSYRKDYRPMGITSVFSRVFENLH